MKNVIRSAVAALLAFGSVHAADIERLGALSPNSRVTTEAGYVTITTRLENARALLDRKADDAMAYARGVSNALSSSSRTAINRANEVYDQLDAKLGIEAERRQAGDAAVAATVQGAYDYATAVSNRLQSGVNANAAAIQSASNTLSAAMAADREDRDSADAALGSRIDGATGYGQSVSNTLSRQIAAVSNYVDDVRSEIPDAEATVAEAVRRSGAYTTAVSNRVEELREDTGGMIAGERAYAEEVSNLYAVAVEDLHSRVTGAEDRADAVSNALAQADAELSDRIDGTEDRIDAVSNAAVTAHAGLDDRITAVSNAFEEADTAIRDDIDEQVARIYSDMAGLNEDGGGPYARVFTNIARAASSNVLERSLVSEGRMLPKYLHEMSFDDSYPEVAEMYYAQRGTAGGCSAVRDGGFLYRNFDYPFDERAEFVVRMRAGKDRFASVGVAQVGENLTETFVCSHRPSVWYRALPGATVDGINGNGVCAEINVVDGDPWMSGWATNRIADALHPLAAVRWVLDHATNALHGTEYIVSHIRFPEGWTQNFHWMIADETSTYVVENGTASNVTGVAEKRVMTNFAILPDTYSGMGKERYDLLRGGASITNAWYTKAYRRETNPVWESEFNSEELARTNDIFDVWASNPRESFRGSSTVWWQTVHTSVYDITNRTLRIAVQEQDDWYVFGLLAGTDERKVREIAGDVSKDIVDESIGRATQPIFSNTNITFTVDGTDLIIRTNDVEVWHSWKSSQSSTAPVKRYALFIIHLNPNSASHPFSDIELKATVNNYYGDSMKFYCASVANGDPSRSGNPEWEHDWCRLYVLSSKVDSDVRRWRRIRNTEDLGTYNPRDLAIIVDPALFRRGQGSEWCCESNDELIWSYVRITPSGAEMDEGGQKQLWRPTMPVKWYTSLPVWANQTSW